MRKTYQITEYGSFVRDREVPGYISLPQDTFDTLESFVLSNSTEDTDALKLMGVSARKGVGKIITAKNYVGVITMNDGTTIEILLNAFNSVDESNEYKSDFAKIVPDRKTADYQTALMWSKVFLMGKSFTSFSGSEVAFALLFPMETLFESYIAAQLKKMLGHSEYSLSAQDKTYHLFDGPRKFLMKPDIVIKNKALAQVFVMDTKWKVLSADKANYAISQADMYQMYAYQKKYTSENVTLLYPLTEKVDPNQNIEFLSNDGTVIRIRFVDLFDLSNSLNAIVGEIKGNE